MIKFKLFANTHDLTCSYYIGKIVREIKIIFVDQMMKTNFKYFNYFQVIYFRCQLLYNSNTKFIYHNELVTIRTELLWATE